MWNKDYVISVLCAGGDSEDSNGVVVAIACVVTFIVTLIVTAIITFVVTYIFVKKKFTSITQDTTGKQPIATTNTIVYDTVGPTNRTSNAAVLEMQPNPAYGTGQKVSMDANPAYESYK